MNRSTARQRGGWAVCALAAILVGSRAELPAQGVIRKEAQAFRFLSERRAELAALWPALDEGTRAAVRERLVGADRGIPFVPVLESLALAQGADVDDGFLLRGTLGMFALPEVVDPDGANEFCQDLHITVFAPYRIVDPASVDVGLRVAVHREGVAAPVWEGSIQERTSLPELMRYQARVAVPGDRLEDGTYTVAVLADVSGTADGSAPAERVAPRPHDPRLTTTFSVCRGFQARAEALLAAEVDAPFWLGMREQVERVYTGGVRHPMSDGRRELAAAEAALAAIRQDPTGDPLGGAIAAWSAAGAGWVPLAVPGTGEHPAMLRLAPARAGAIQGGDQRGLLFVPGAPAHDARGRRPDGPRSTDPGWLAAQLAGRDELEQRPVAVLESTGRGTSAAQDLERTVQWLRDLWDDIPIVLAAERESAVVAGHTLAKLRPHLAGVFLLGGGSLHRAQLAAIGDLPVQVVAEYGTPASANQAAFVRLLAGEFGALPAGLTVAVADERAPWCLGLGVQLGSFLAWEAELSR